MADNEARTEPASSRATHSRAQASRSARRARDRGKLEVLRDADRIFLEEIRDAGLYDRIWQPFAVLLPSA